MRFLESQVVNHSFEVEEQRPYLIEAKWWVYLLIKCNMVRLERKPNSQNRT